MNDSGVPSCGFSKMMSLGSRRGASMETNTSGFQDLWKCVYRSTLEDKEVSWPKLAAIGRIVHPESSPAGKHE